VSDDIGALLGESSDSDMAVPATIDEQVALLTSFKTAHREEGTCKFMAAEWEALTAMLVVRANAAREAARSCPGGGGTCGGGRGRGGSGSGGPGGSGSCGGTGR
jgi:hypothetical protein